MIVDFYHDVSCPWCRIARRYLLRAMDRWHVGMVEVRYHPFFVNPGLPREGMDDRAFHSSRIGSQTTTSDTSEAARRAGTQAGLTFHFESITRVPNTILAHRLIAFAPNELKEAMIDRIYAAYFEQGQDPGDVTTLVRVAIQAGLNAKEVRAYLGSSEGEAEVLADYDRALSNGIPSAPFTVIERQYSIRGIQTSEIILRVMEKAARERTA